MKKLVLVISIAVWAANFLTSQELKPKVSISYGSFRTPYWYIVSEASGTFPVGTIWDRALEIEVRTRGFGTFYFFHPQSTDSEMTLKIHAFQESFFSVRALAAFEADWRNFNDSRSTAVSTFAPVLGAEVLSRWDWFWVSPRVEALFYRDGLTAKGSATFGGKWGSFEAFIRLETSEVWAIQKALAEFHWESFVGLSYEF